MPELPAIVGLLPSCPTPLTTWGDLVACVNSAGDAGTVYRAAVDAYASTLQFNWSDVETWAAARTADGKVAEARVVFLSGDKTSLEDGEAAAAVTDLTGGKELANVVRQKAPAFANFWKSAEGELQPFADYGSQVRVSLVPLVLNEQGQVIALDARHQLVGVFVDCLNPHGLWQRVPEVPGGKLPSATAESTQPTAETTTTQPANPGTTTTTNPPPATTAAGKGTTNPDSENGYWGSADAGQAEAQAPAGPAASADGGSGWTQAAPADPSTQQGAKNDQGQVGGATADSDTTAGGGDKADTTDGGNAGGSGQGGDVDPGD
jgi:hypothetical protein